MKLESVSIVGFRTSAPLCLNINFSSTVRLVARRHFRFLLSRILTTRKLSKIYLTRNLKRFREVSTLEFTNDLHEYQVGFMCRRFFYKRVPFIVQVQGSCRLSCDYPVGSLTQYFDICPWRMSNQSTLFTVCSIKVADYP